MKDIFENVKEISKKTYIETEKKTNFVINKTESLSGYNLVDFFKEEAENPIPKAEDVRQSYFKELKKMGGSSCSSCQTFGLMNKYKNILRNKNFL